MARKGVHDAAEKGDLSEVERLLLSGKDIFLTKDGRTCLHLASENGHLEVVKVLVEKGGERLLMIQAGDGRTCLHLASENGHLEVVKVLVEKGGERLLMSQVQWLDWFDVLFEDGRTCLHLASENGHLEVVKVLVEKGGERLLMSWDEGPAEKRRSFLYSLVHDFGLAEDDEDGTGIVKVLLEAGGKEVAAEAMKRYMGHRWVARAVEWYEDRQVDAKLLALFMGTNQRLGAQVNCFVKRVIDHPELIREEVRGELRVLVGLAALNE